VAQAAMDSGVARKPIELALYETRLQERTTEIASL